MYLHIFIIYIQFFANFLSEYFLVVLPDARQLNSQFGFKFLARELWKEMCIRMNVSLYFMNKLDQTLIPPNT